VKRAWILASACAGALWLQAAASAQQAKAEPATGASQAAADNPAGTPAVSACIACHSDPARVPLASARDPVVRFADDVHASKGLSCHDCHGGRADVELMSPQAEEHAHALTSGFVGKPDAKATPEFCGRCHADAAYMARFNPDARVDQLAIYQTSVHGEMLAAGDGKVAQCISCHGSHPEDKPEGALAHGIRAVNDPLSAVFPTRVADTCARCHSNAEYMQSYGIPTDQREEYVHSVHGKALLEKEDLSAPTCNDCHGNHGARPPEVESMAFVCGTCHARQADLFRQSTMKPAFDELGVGECIVCHSNHRVEQPTDAMLFSEPLADGKSATGCYTCHGDAEDPALAISRDVHAGLTHLTGRIEAAHATLGNAAAKGMPVAEAQFEMSGATDALIEARALVHLFRTEPVLEATKRGAAIADAAELQGQDAIKDFYFRYRWLGMSLLGIAFVIVSLWLKMRQVDRRWRAGAGSEHAAG